MLVKNKISALAGAVVMAAVFGMSSSASAQTAVVYNGLGVSPFAAVAGNGGAHVLESLSTTSGGFLDSIQFGITVKAASPSSIIFFDFYSGADFSAADPLAGAVRLGGFGFDLGSRTTAGGFLFNPITLTGADRIPLTTTNLAVEWTFAAVGATGGLVFNPNLSPRVSVDSATDVGTESDTVFADANLNGTFEQSELIARTGQFRSVLTVVVPEPSALGLLAPAGLLLARRRRA